MDRFTQADTAARAARNTWLADSIAILDALDQAGIIGDPPAGFEAAVLADRHGVADAA